jgi:hypothetical protein
MMWTIVVLIAAVAAVLIARKIREGKSKNQEAQGVARSMEATQKDLVSQALGSRPPRPEVEE